MSIIKKSGRGSFELPTLMWVERVLWPSLSVGEPVPAKSVDSALKYFLFVLVFFFFNIFFLKILCAKGFYLKLNFNEQIWLIV